MLYKSKLMALIPTFIYQSIGPIYNVFQNSCLCMNRPLLLTQKLKYSIFSINNKKILKIRSIPNNYYNKFFENNVKFIHSSSQCGNISDRVVPHSPEEVKELLSQNPVPNPDSKVLKVAIIGVPNSGKSTLINQLLGWKICSVSSKVHTTKCNARAISNHDNTQLVYLDTPGIVTPEEIKKYKLTKSLVIDPEKSLEQADLVAVLHDASNSYTHRSLHSRVMRLLLLFPMIPSVLILNKVDLIKKKDVLLEITRTLTDGVLGSTKVNVVTLKIKNEEQLRRSLLNLNTSEDDLVEDVDKVSDDTRNTSNEHEFVRDSYDRLDDNSKSSVDEYEEETSKENLSFEDVISGRINPTEKQVQKLLEGRKGWPLFKEVFMTSALDGLGVEDLRDYFLDSAKKAQWIFSDDIVTDQSPQEIVLMTVREKCLEILPNNVPYELKFKILNWHVSDADVLSIFLGLYSRNKSHIRVAIGPGGSRVKMISKNAEQDLRNTFRTEVRLRIACEYDRSIKDSDI